MPTLHSQFHVRMMSALQSDTRQREWNANAIMLWNASEIFNRGWSHNLLSIEKKTVVSFYIRSVQMVANPTKSVRSGWLWSFMFVSEDIPVAARQMLATQVQPLTHKPRVQTWHQEISCYHWVTDHKASCIQAPKIFMTHINRSLQQYQKVNDSFNSRVCPRERNFLYSEGANTLTQHNSQNKAIIVWLAMTQNFSSYSVIQVKRIWQICNLFSENCNVSYHHFDKPHFN
jgi:hypothetical protein